MATETRRHRGRRWAAKVLCVSVSLWLPLHAAAKLQWPVRKQLKIQISSTFGESRNDHFHNGLDLPGDGLSVRPVADGRLVWHTRGRARTGEIPFGGGGTVVLDHGKLSSGYMHLSSISQKLLSSHKATTAQPLGISGNTGHSGGAHIHFFVYETAQQKMHNPLLMLPELHYQDEKPPRALGYGILLPERMAQVRLERPIIMSRELPVYAQLQDMGVRSERWGVHYLRVFNRENSETPIYEVEFNFLLFRAGKWVTSNNQPFDRVYYRNWYFLGQQFKSTGQLKWVAGGLRGPATTVSQRLNVRDR